MGLLVKFEPPFLYSWSHIFLAILFLYISDESGLSLLDCPFALFG